MTPEKIYIVNDDLNIKREWYKTKQVGFETTEYTRTDAFIERAEDFIRRKICDYVVHYNYGPNNDMETMYVDNRFFDEFKNYMKE